MNRGKIVWKSPEDLRPHPLNRELYGPPTANSAYKDIRDSMKANGFDERQPLLITTDGRILWGTTRNDIAKKQGLKEVPCEIFQPSSEQPELEYERELIRGNIQRSKTQVMLTREQRKMLELQKSLARARMGGGNDGGPSKSADRVGKEFKVSGKTVARRIKVLNAIEQAEADGEQKKAERLTELLNANQVVKALNAIANKAATPRKPPAVTVPRTLNDHTVIAYSEFFEACTKVKVQAECDILEATLGRMHDDLQAARTRLNR
jgi:hypothetical protein